MANLLCTVVAGVLPRRMDDPGLFLTNRAPNQYILIITMLHLPIVVNRQRVNLDIRVGYFMHDHDTPDLCVRPPRKPPSCHTPRKWITTGTTDHGVPAVHRPTCRQGQADRGVISHL